MNIKKLFRPSGEKVETKEVQSFKLTWHTKSGWSGDYNVHYKVFLTKTEANEYLEALEEANKFLQTRFELNASIVEN